MKTGVDTSTMFDDLKQGLSAPIAGMSVSFTSSLFGLASSLILGFLDLQAGQAQNRFYSEFEEFLASHVQTTPVAEAAPEAPIIAQGAQPAIEYQRDAKAIATLAEGIQALVGHMRPNSSKFAIGSTRRRRSRKISASSCGASWTNWGRDEAREFRAAGGSGVKSWRCRADADMRR